MGRKKELDKLTRDVLAAEAAGYGPWYGRYIAAFGHTAEPEPRKTKERASICQICGCEFIQPDYHPRKYCSADCRETARQRQNTASKARNAERRKNLTDCAALPV